MAYFPVELKIWGEYACFTRPEMKVERVSYEVMTPSAARGILEAIFWKPEFQWQIREIRVLKPIRFFSIRRNEVNNRANTQFAQRILAGESHYFADEDRAQRHTLGLRDVAYVVVAEAVLREDVKEDAAKYIAQFHRRVERGQCHSMPYLGCREFAASFEPPDGSERPQVLSVELGRMLFDLDYETDGSGRGTPRFFEAKLESGILWVPRDLYAKGA